MQRVDVSLLWEWIGFAVRAEHLLLREEKGISNDFPYGSSSRNTNPGSTTGWPYRNNFISVSFYPSEAVWVACFKVLWESLCMDNCSYLMMIHTYHETCNVLMSFSYGQLKCMFFFLLFWSFYLGCSPPKQTAYRTHKNCVKLKLS